MVNEHDLAQSSEAWPAGWPRALDVFGQEPYSGELVTIEKLPADLPYGVHVARLPGADGVRGHRGGNPLSSR